MSRRKFILVPLILTILVSSVAALYTYSPRVTVPSEVEDKLSSDLIEALKTVPTWCTIECIVGCNWGSGSFVEQVENEVGDLIITKVWVDFRAFLANLYPEQVIEVARLDIVWRIDLNAQINPHS